MATIYGVEKSTVYLDPTDYRRLRAMAEAANRPAAELIREAVAEYVRRHGGAPQPSSLGAGRSGRGDLAERAEELLKDMGRE
jgi:predicted transcriptional regulator